MSNPRKPAMGEAQRAFPRALPTPVRPDYESAALPLSYAGPGAHSNKPSWRIQPRRRALLKGKVPIGPRGSTSGLTAGTCCFFSPAAPLGTCSLR